MFRGPRVQFRSFRGKFRSSQAKLKGPGSGSEGPEASSQASRLSLKALELISEAPGQNPRVRELSSEVLVPRLNRLQLILGKIERYISFASKNHLKVAPEQSS